MSCYSCGKNKRLFQDFRARNGILSRYASCYECLHTGDVDYFNMSDKTRSGVEAIGEVEIIVRCKDVSSKDLLDMINKHLDKNDILPDREDIDMYVRPIN